MKILIAAFLFIALSACCGPREEELISAVKNNDFRRVRDLVLAGADVNYLDADGNCALGLAQRSNLKNIAYFLASRGAKARVEVYENSPCKEDTEKRRRIDKKACHNNIILLTNVLEFYLSTHHSLPDISELANYCPDLTLPKCPCGGEYSIKRDDWRGYYIVCSKHGRAVP